MGWASGTELFDGAVDVAVSFIAASPPQKRMITAAIVSEMYTKVDWGDWDTQDESKYYDPYLIDVMNDLDEVEPNYYAWYKAGRPDDWDW